MNLKPFEEKPNEIDFFENKKTNKIYVSKQFSELETKDTARFASQAIDGTENHYFVKGVGETVLHVSDGERIEIKALFYEDSREIKTFTIQKFFKTSDKPYGTNKAVSFTFTGDEIKTFVDFICSIPNLDLSNPNKIKIDDDAIKELLLSKEQALNLFKNNRTVFEELYKNEITISDIVNLRYKKEQLRYFKQLLEDDDFFENEKRMTSARGNEQVWQNFFEKNTWILGYGLNFIFNTPLEEEKLEQVVSGANVFSAGKRVDALMKTRGIINSLCFCEIKTHTTNLLKKIKTSYRLEVWSVSDELAGGVGQIQRTVQKSIENIKTKTQIKDQQGNLTNEEVFLYNPKSFLLIGSLKEFKGDNGTNEDKFSSFELFRQNIFKPEIITFDELFERAKFIMDIAEHNENIPSESNIIDDNFPF
ncbi:MAG: Shedu immune nuclease family protein [Acidobacteriota bacterium]